jgi:hypothetical protein
MNGHALTRCLGRMKDLAELSVRIAASLTRTDLFADLELEPERKGKRTPDPDSPSAEINLTSWGGKVDYSSRVGTSLY